MWKVGLIGTGYWSEKHLNAWSRIPNVEVTALCNRSSEKLIQKGKEYHIAEDQLYTSIEEMLEKADIDIVDIVTGPETHLDFVKKAAAANKHIMCQKPFSPKLEDAEKMVRLAEDAGVRLMVTENWRWLQPFQELKKLLDSDYIGKLNVVRYIHTDFYTPRMAEGVELPQPFFRTMPKLLFYEMGVHWFDTWRFLFGTPRRLYAETTKVSPHIVGEDSGIIVLGYDDFYGFMDMSWATRQKLESKLTEEVGPVHLEQMIIEGNEGTLKLYTNGQIIFIDNRGVKSNVVESTEYDHEESHYRLQTHFIHCLDTGEEFQTSGRDNLVTLKMTFGTYKSSSEHRPVIFE